MVGRRGKIRGLRTRRGKKGEGNEEEVDFLLSPSYLLRWKKKEWGEARFSCLPPPPPRRRRKRWGEEEEEEEKEGAWESVSLFPGRPLSWEGITLQGTQFAYIGVVLGN